jgi:hypothetical protein
MDDISSMISKWQEGGICLRPLASQYGISAATAKKYLNQSGIDTSKRSCFSRKKWDIIESINTVLKEYETRLTVRQVFYQLATRQIVPLSTKGYHSVVSACNKGRKQGYISWDSIEDRTRQPHTVPMWQGLDDFKHTILQAYRRDIWLNQDNYFEVWLEKNALYGLISPITSKYGITLQTITGYSSISAIYEGSKRLNDGDTLLYLGDHDATGIDIDRSIKESFKHDHNLSIDVKRVGLLYEDIEKYNLLPNPIKESDPRAKNYPYEKQAELDALPPDILINRIESAIRSHLDLEAYNEGMRIQKEELNKIKSSFDAVQRMGW